MSIRWKAKEMAQWRKYLMNYGRTCRTILQSVAQNPSNAWNATKSKAELCALVVLWSWRWRACPKSSVIWFISERSKAVWKCSLLEEAWWRLRGDTDPPQVPPVTQGVGESIVWYSSRVPCHHNRLALPSPYRLYIEILPIPVAWLPGLAHPGFWP